MVPLVQDSSQYLLSLLEFLPDPTPSNPPDKKAPSRSKSKKNTPSGALDVVANGDTSFNTKVLDQSMSCTLKQHHRSDVWRASLGFGFTQAITQTDRQTDRQTDTL